MPFPTSLGLDFGSNSTAQSTVDTAPISNEGFTGAFAVGAGASARTDSQFSPTQTSERTGSPFSQNAFPMEVIYIGAAVLVVAIVLKKVLK